MKLLAETKQFVQALTDTEVLLKNYDRAAERARQFASSQPKNILQAWAKSFPAQEREVIPPLAFLGGQPRSGTTLLVQNADAFTSTRQHSTRSLTAYAKGGEGTHPIFPQTAHNVCRAFL